MTEVLTFVAFAASIIVGVLGLFTTYDKNKPYSGKSSIGRWVARLTGSGRALAVTALVGFVSQGIALYREDVEDAEQNASIGRRRQLEDENRRKDEVFQTKQQEWQAKVIALQETNNLLQAKLDTKTSSLEAKTQSLVDGQAAAVALATTANQNLDAVRTTAAGCPRKVRDKIAGNLNAVGFAVSGLAFVETWREVRRPSCATPNDVRDVVASVCKLPPGDEPKQNAPGVVPAPDSLEPVSSGADSELLARTPSGAEGDATAGSSAIDEKAAAPRDPESVTPESTSAAPQADADDDAKAD